MVNTHTHPHFFSTSLSVLSDRDQNKNIWLISKGLVGFFCLFSLFKFPRRGHGLLLLFRRPFRVRLLHQQNQNRSVRQMIPQKQTCISYYHSYLIQPTTKSVHYCWLSCGYLPFGRETPGDGEEGVESTLSAALSALYNLLAAVTNPVLAANRIMGQCLLYATAVPPNGQTHVRQAVPFWSIYLNCFSLHMNWMSASSSGSLHFSSRAVQSTTSGSRNKPLASLYSQSSGEGCFCKTTTTRRIRKDWEAHRKLLRRPSGSYVRLGRCFRGFPRWSRAVWWGRWPVWGRFPWWCRSSRSQAGCKGRWTKIKGGAWMHNWKPQKQLFKFWTISQADLSEEKLYLFVCQADVLQHPSQVELLNWKFP